MSETLYFAISRVFSSSMTKVFSNFNWKYSNKAFLVSNLNFFIQKKTLHLDKFKDADFKYDNIFKIAAQKMLIEGIFSAKFLDFYFCTKLCSDIFQSAGLKYGNRFSKLQPKNTPTKLFWSRSWKLFALRETLQCKMFESIGVK